MKLTIIICNEDPHFGKTLNHLQQLFPLAALPVAGDKKSRSADALTRGLNIVRITITEANQAPRLIGPIEIGSMNSVNAETDDITAFRWNWNRVFKFINIGRQVG